MKNTVNVLQYAVRLLALLQVALGFQFWSGRSFTLLPVHMRMGEMLIALLWILAGIGLRAGIKPGLTLGAIAYGFLVYAFAMNMGKLLPGGAHEVNIDQFFWLHDRIIGAGGESQVEGPRRRSEWTLVARVVTGK